MKQLEIIIYSTMVSNQLTNNQEVLQDTVYTE